MEDSEVHSQVTGRAYLSPTLECLTSFLPLLKGRMHRRACCLAGGWYTGIDGAPVDAMTRCGCIFTLPTTT